MKRIFILFALISFTIFTACNKEEMADTIVPAEEELELETVTYQVERPRGNTAVLGRADFTIDNEDNTLSEGDDLLLTNNSVNAVSYFWDFGNGHSSTEANPTFDNYKVHGSFSVTLTVTDANGKTDQLSQNVEVLCIFGGAPHEF